MRFVVISKYIFKVQSNHFSVALVPAHQKWSCQWLTSSYSSSRIHAFVLSILETLLAGLEANHASMSLKTDGMAYFSSLIFLCFTQHATIVWDRLLLYCLAHLYKEGLSGAQVADYIYVGLLLWDGNRWLPVFWTVRLVWSDGLWRDRTVRHYTRTTSGHARHCLRALWRVLRDSRLSGVRARKVRWRAERSDIMRGRPCSELIHYIVKMTVAVVLDTSSFAYRNMARTEKTYLLPMCLS